MGNIDEKRLSALLERIDNIKAELAALENEVREFGEVTEQTQSVTEPISPVTEPAEATATVVRQDSPTAEAAVPMETSSVPTDDTPIEIDIPDMEIPPIIEDPATEYTTASEHRQTQYTATPEADDIPVTEPEVTSEPNSQVTEPAEVTEPVEVTVPAETAKHSEVTEPAEASMEPKAPTEPTTLDDLPFDDDLPADAPSAAPKAKAAILDSQKAETAVMDVMAEKQAWRTDRPGSPVKNVISAISLNDRVLLINVLFKEDPILFQNTISAFNGMTTLDEALTYIKSNFPDWDLNSEPVYRLMMAVRRKLK